VPRPPLLPRELEDSSDCDDESRIPSLERPDEPLNPSLERPDEPLNPSLDRPDEPLNPSLERPDEPLMPEDLSLLDEELPPRDEELDPDDALRLLSELPEDADNPPPLLLELPLLLPPFDDAFRPPVPERSCELPRPEFVLPDAPSP
jgi:hypothetical protein